MVEGEILAIFASFMIKYKTATNSSHSPGQVLPMLEFSGFLCDVLWWWIYILVNGIMEAMMIMSLGDDFFKDLWGDSVCSYLKYLDEFNLSAPH